MNSLSTKIKRIVKHACVMPWQVRRVFSKSICQSIEQTITTSEQNHRAEIRFVVEGALHVHHLLHNVSARERAVELFSSLRMWDTEHNTGVLVYALFAERQLEIVADRGISARVSQQEWDIICADMIKAFQQGQFESGVIDGLKRITDLLNKHFPDASTYNINELSNQVILL